MCGFLGPPPQTGYRTLPSSPAPSREFPQAVLALEGNGTMPPLVVELLSCDVVSLCRLLREAWG